MSPVTMYMLTCICLFYTCFCRLVRTSQETEVWVRLAFVGLAGACAVSFTLAWKRHYLPTYFDLILPTAMLFVQAITARYWREGVPPHFQKCKCPKGYVKE